jgi:DNA mismatch repair protein MutS
MVKSTPLMRQYLAIKEKYQDAILFFRMGDFYEMFFEDAKVASKILDIALTSREKNGVNPIPLCGVPYHAADNYLAKLIKAGKKVAVCEQVEDPATAKGIVKREVVRVVTPGTIRETNLLNDRQNNFLAAVVFDSKNKQIGLAVTDMSTGELKVTEISGADQNTILQEELARLRPAEIIIPRSLYTNLKILSRLRWQPAVNITPAEDWTFSEADAANKIREQYQVPMLDGLGLSAATSGVAVTGALISYLQATQKIYLKHLRPPQFYSRSDFMLLDEATIRNLEIVSTLRADDRQSSLLAMMDQCQTAMGGRLLYNTLLQPLIKSRLIRERQAGVAEFLAAETWHNEVRETLAGVADIERLAGRLGTDAASPRDLLALQISLQNVKSLKMLLADGKSAILRNFYKQIDPLDRVVSLIGRSIRAEAPPTLREGGVIKPGFDKKLDEIRALTTQGKDWLKNLEATERKKSGIEKLKVRYNRVFGYYIEVPKGQVGKVPAHYIRKQTLVNAERYITPEMKEREELILNSEERLIAAEAEIFAAVRQKIAEEIPVLQATARAVAFVDLLASFALTARARSYTQPRVDDSDRLVIKDGRHPVVERIEGAGDFVPNDTKLDTKNEQVAIITGPNMSGKSTYIRQVAVITLLAQTGSFVPARSATIGVVDRIFTRVGASDNLVRGQSTFMVEMQETANILNSATPRSLIVLDEIGRGTSTFDGISIAWAVVEYIHSRQNLGAKTLFATHYHELLELEKLLPRVKNYNVAVRESRDEVNFLYKIIPGGTNKSYGIYVGKLAGIPAPVISRAQQVLSKLEKGEKSFRSEVAKNRLADRQASLFTPPRPSAVETEIARADINKLTPLEALQLLDKIKKKVN